MNFREVDRKLCLIQDSRFVLALDPEQKTKANAVLFFGYIDHTRGLTYEALGLVRCEGNDYALVSDAQVVGLKVRADAVDEERVRPIENKTLEELLRDRIDMLSVYYANKDVVAIRTIEEIDPFRHPQYPDDNNERNSVTRKKKGFHLKSAGFPAYLRISRSIPIGVLDLSLYYGDPKPDRVGLFPAAAASR